MRKWGFLCINNPKMRKSGVTQYFSIIFSLKIPKMLSAWPSATIRACLNWIQCLDALADNGDAPARPFSRIPIFTRLSCAALLAHMDCPGIDEISGPYVLSDTN